jgi:Holliday junction DNA helicase RuvB
VDEIHRLSPVVEEYLYPALEDFTLDILLDRGPSARSLKLNLERSRWWAPPRARPAVVAAARALRRDAAARLLRAEDLATIVRRSAGILRGDRGRRGRSRSPRRARGTPRVANRLLRRVRDFALIKADGGSRCR